MAVDIIPSIVILVNAMVIALSSDYDTSGMGWQIVEVFFVAFYTLEVYFRIRLLGGVRVLFCGPDWPWNYFDLMCLVFSWTDMLVWWSAYIFKMATSLELNDVVGLLKFMRLARLCRLVRLMRFSSVQELQVMVQGVLSGLKVLFWAIILLFFTVFLVGVICRKAFPDEPEFADIPSATFTIFRCLTDGCDSYDGSPLTETLRSKYGFGFTIFYMLVYLFVTIGIFNLIMAVFIDRVVHDHLSKELSKLGLDAQYHQNRITEVMKDLMSPKGLKLAETKVRGSRFSNFMQGFRSSYLQGEVAVLEDIEAIPISRKQFDEWLENPFFLELLAECHVDVSSKAELFDTLNTDMSGILHMKELVTGLLKLRGPITKSDIIATRLKTRYCTEMLLEVRESLAVIRGMLSGSGDSIGKRETE
eukprot:TRINITY_DN20074_c0_g1_i1.p1 TRINITY_DN20074_c0_g1~~TRINITY_DN20074_c0_g1_i1.p1  ORF type:complete len:472 (+),score=45.82 TRINITY_DN20074_c0_g1_i1:168-1418(+)